MTSSAKKDMIIRWHDKQVATVEQTARLLGLTEQEVRDVLAEAENRHPAVRTTTPEFIQPPALTD